MFEHRKMSGAVLKLQDKKNPTAVEAELQKVISAFAQLQEDRYKADYDVGWFWSRTDVKNTWPLRMRHSRYGRASARKRWRGTT